MFLWPQQGGQDMDSPGQPVGGPSLTSSTSQCLWSEQCLDVVLNSVMSGRLSARKGCLDAVVLPQTRGAMFRNEPPCLPSVLR